MSANQHALCSDCNTWQPIGMLKPTRRGGEMYLCIHVVCGDRLETALTNLCTGLREALIAERGRAAVGAWWNEDGQRVVWHPGYRMRTAPLGKGRG